MDWYSRESQGVTTSRTATNREPEVIMPMKDDPDLEDALDGLINATNYCEQHGHDELAREASGLYQAVALASDEDEWDDPEPVTDRE